MESSSTKVQTTLPSCKVLKSSFGEKKLKSKEINELDCTKCKICNLTYKLTDRIGHCDKCEICYYGYDHHCIWIGHCIGKYNGFIKN